MTLWRASNQIDCFTQHYWVNIHFCKTQGAIKKKIPQGSYTNCAPMFFLQFNLLGKNGCYIYKVVLWNVGVDRGDQKRM